MYNRSKIMKAALVKHHRYGWSLKNALRAAWMEAKSEAPIWCVYGDGKVLFSGVSYNRAGELQDMYKHSYWNVEIKAA